MLISSSSSFYSTYICNNVEGWLGSICPMKDYSESKFDVNVLHLLLLLVIRKTGMC